MSGYALAAALLIFSFATCVLAFAKGRVPERIGAAIILANLLAGMAIEAFLPGAVGQLAILVVDALTALALLPVTMRYVSVWLGAVMLLYGLQFALHAYYAVLDRPRDLLHFALNNIDFFAINFSLAVGTFMAWSRQRNLKAAG